MAKIVYDERINRTRAERLLSDIQSSHQKLTQYSAHALDITRERNELAREIHDSLGHYLTVVNVQLEKALAFRQIDAAAAEQAVRDAKHLASEALHHVRRSVRALRVTPAMFDCDVVSTVKGLPVGGHERPDRSIHLFRGRRWKRWIAPRPFDAVTTVLYLAMLAGDLSWSDASDPFLSWKSLWLTVVVVTLLALDRLDYYMYAGKPEPKAGIVLIALRFVLILAIGAISGPWYMVWLLPFLPYVGFIYFGNRGGYTVAGLVAFVLTGGISAMVVSDLQTGSFEIMNLVAGSTYMSLLLLLVISTSKRIVKERESRSRAETLRLQLVQAHVQLKGSAQRALAAMDERNHLAREIHDGLGHYLTVVNVQLEKALAFRTISPAVADQAISDAKRLSHEALADIRGSIGALDSAHAITSFRDTLTRLARNVGVNMVVDVHILGSEEGCSKQSLFVLYRVVQEGLTNIQKHAGASQIKVQLTFADTEVKLSLRDNGCGFDHGSCEATRGVASYGLQGIRERLELVGGSLELESGLGRGTELRITVPKEPLMGTTWPPEQRQGVEV